MCGPLTTQLTTWIRHCACACVHDKHYSMKLVEWSLLYQNSKNGDLIP
jgi:hypothetical protein